MTARRGLRDIEPWLASCTFPPAGHAIVCGVSGGADSVALLALATAARCDVTAVHVDHGQREGSAAEASVVRSIAEMLGARFEWHPVDVAPGPNLEARMRAARHGVLGSEAATGHTLDDQAETVLINLLRGAGVRGLGAMQPGVRRPILGLRRRDTQAICVALGIEPIVDPSNADPRFVRNRVRHEVLPLLDEIAGRDVVPLLARMSSTARAAQAVIDDAARDLDPTDARAVSIAAEPVAASAIQRWIREQTGAEYLVDHAAVERVLGVARGAAVAAEVAGGHRISRSANRLSVETPGEGRTSTTD